MQHLGADHAMLSEITKKKIKSYIQTLQASVSVRSQRALQNN